MKVTYLSKLSTDTRQGQVIQLRDMEDGEVVRSSPSRLHKREGDYYYEMINGVWVNDWDRNGWNVPKVLRSHSVYTITGVIQ